MNALKKQSIQRLCERLGAFRLRGPIPALMAEYAVGTPEDEHRPLDGFVGTVVSNGLGELRGGQQFVRSVWLAGDCALVEEFRIFCGQAAQLVMQLLHSAGYEVGLHAPNSQAHWQWAVFELSEMRVDGTSLQLAGGDVFRRVGQSIITVGEQMQWDAEHRAKKRPFDPLIASAGNTRY